MSAMHTTPATFRSVMKPSARFSSARASAMPVDLLDRLARLLHPAEVDHL